MSEEEKNPDAPNPARILYGVFAVIILPVSMVVFFLSSWFVAWTRAGWQGILLNSALMTILGFVGARLAAEDVTKEEKEAKPKVD